MKKIPLTRGYVAEVDDADYDKVMAAGPWTALITPNTVYAWRHRGGKSQLMHRFLLGLTDRRIQFDHCDLDGLNNQRWNLRACTLSQNMANSPKRRGAYTSTYKGVYWHKAAGKWGAGIRVNGKTRYLGLFTDEAAAAAAYRAAARKHFGPFTRR
jgi:hypothetical protein